MQRVAVVGEIYTKYCRLGNWDLMSFLASESCEVGVGGVTWYALYYMDSHSLKGSVVSRRPLTGCWQDTLPACSGRCWRFCAKQASALCRPWRSVSGRLSGHAPLDLRVADGG